MIHNALPSSDLCLPPLQGGGRTKAPPRKDLRYMQRYWPWGSEANHARTFPPLVTLAGLSLTLLPGGAAPPDRGQDTPPQAGRSPAADPAKLIEELGGMIAGHLDAARIAE